MANFFFLQTLIPLLFFIATANSQSTSFSYDFYGSQPTDLIYQGDAFFPSGSTYLRLTRTDSTELRPQSDTTGRVLYSKPIKFWEAGAQVDFETTLKFIIRPIDINPGDGLVFFIAPVGSTIPIGSNGRPLVGGNFGVFPTSSGRNPSIFAVEFDTFYNPNVDPYFRHVGINIEHLRSSNVTDVGIAIFGQEVTARINYQEANNVISVRVSAGTQVFEVSYVFDLSTVLEQEVQVGLSASSGGSVSIHDIISWYFSSTLVKEGSNAAGIRQYV